MTRKIRFEGGPLGGGVVEVEKTPCKQCGRESCCMIAWQTPNGPYYEWRCELHTPQDDGDAPSLTRAPERKFDANGIVERVVH